IKILPELDRKLGVENLLLTPRPLGQVLGVVDEDDIEGLPPCFSHLLIGPVKLISQSVSVAEIGQCLPFNHRLVKSSLGQRRLGPQVPPVVTVAQCSAFDGKSTASEEYVRNGRLRAKLAMGMLTRV